MEKFKIEQGVFWAWATAQREVGCPACGELVLKGEQRCIWVQDEGIFHEECVERPDAGE